jgi:cytidine deaminase
MRGFVPKGIVFLSLGIASFGGDVEARVDFRPSVPLPAPRPPGPVPLLPLECNPPISRISTPSDSFESRLARPVATGPSFFANAPLVLNGNQLPRGLTPVVVRKYMDQALAMAKHQFVGAIAVQPGFSQCEPAEAVKQNLAGQGYNIEFNEHNTVCAERVALANLVEGSELAGHGAAPVQALFLSFKNPQDASITSPAPCAICLDAFRYQKLSPSTLLFSTRVEPDQQVSIQAHTLRDYLPEKAGNPEPNYFTAGQLAQLQMGTLPVVPSSAAQKLFMSKFLGGDLPSAARTLMAEAQKQFRAHEAKGLNANPENELAAVSLWRANPPLMTTGHAVYAANRIFNLPSLQSLEGAPSKDGKADLASLAMMAFYSESDLRKQPSTLEGGGLLNMLGGHGVRDLPVAILEKDATGTLRIAVRTLREIFPIQYEKAPKPHAPPANPFNVTRPI